MRRVGIALGLLSAALRAQGECERLTPMARAGVVSAGIGLGLDLLRIQSEKDSVVLAPVVVESMLLALQEGASGKTRRELFRLIPSNVSPQVLGCLLNEWRHPGTTPSEPVSGLAIDLSGKIWVRDGIKLLDSYAKLLQEDLSWSYDAVNFTDGSGLDSINSWIGEQTGGGVEKFFTKQMVDSSTEMVLASTARFKGKWSLPFDSSLTSAGTFKLASGGNVPAQMMQVEAFFPYAERPQEQILLLPIQGQDQRWAFMIVVPRKGSAYELAKDLHSSSWSQWLASTQSRFVQLTFPRLKLRQKIDLIEDLRNLGIKDLFDPDADLSNMSDTPHLFVGAAVTEALLEVNEVGLQASAAAGASIRTLALREPPEKISITVDQPFLYAIVDRRTGALLFVGRCEQPGVQ